MNRKKIVRHRAKSSENGALFPELSEDPWPSRKTGKAGPDSFSGLTTVEMCAGGGGEALGFETAGIEHVALVELDKNACRTLRQNRPHWNTLEQDLTEFDGAPFKGVDILSGGLPCPPFSVAGRQLGSKDERNLFPSMIRLVDQIRPQAVMIENVRGILDPAFQDYRALISEQLSRLGYQTGWRMMNASDFGVPQLRPRVLFVAVRSALSEFFAWPEPRPMTVTPVGDVLFDLMASRGWKGAEAWRQQANEIAPTIVGGSLKHGGPDLGPTRARKAWASLAVDGLGIGDEAPSPDFTGMPRLTVRMVARLQGFPDSWSFAGGKTAQYRQVGNAFPPPFAKAMAESLTSCLSRLRQLRITG